MPDSTHIAQVVKPYTNASGKYVATAQHALSHFLAQLLRFMGLEEGEDEEGRLIVVSEDVSYACHCSVCSICIFRALEQLEVSLRTAQIMTRPIHSRTIQTDGCCFWSLE